MCLLSRDEMFKRSLGQLKADILRANSLVQEANVLAEEMGRQTTFSVTLQIPPANLSPNRKVSVEILLIFIPVFYVILKIVCSVCSLLVAKDSSSVSDWYI
jgi:hypothetical protein